jgi:hypothetical protein
MALPDFIANDEQRCQEIGLLTLNMRFATTSFVFICRYHLREYHYQI